jgi:hypothetical protein
VDGKEQQRFVPSTGFSSVHMVKVFFIKAIVLHQRQSDG